MQGKQNARASIRLSSNSRQLDISLNLQNASSETKDSADFDALTPTIALTSSFTQTSKTRPSRQYIYNGKKRPTKDLRGILPSVTFTPDDLNLAKGSNRYRRRELDLVGSQVNANYYQLVHDYEKVLRQKNRLLKEEADMSLLEAADEVFKTVANQLTKYRKSLFSRIVPKITEHYEALATGKNEHLSARYVEGHSESDEELQPTLFDELQAHKALAGPHLHAINFYINSMLVQDFASQGQQRSVVLAIKLAESELIEEMLQQLPVLLLDDVMSELDEVRRQALVKELLTGKQAFITTANINYFEPEILKLAKIVTFEKE